MKNMIVYVSKDTPIINEKEKKKKRREKRDFLINSFKRGKLTSFL